MTTATLSVGRLAPRVRSRRVSAVPTLTFRRLALTVRTPRSLVAPLLTPVLFALVIAPALANTVASPAQRTTYMTFIALATAGLLIPLNCMFAGIGVIVDRQQGAMRELLVAPIRRSSIVLGNLVAALAITALQLAVLIGASALRGAQYQTTSRVFWFVAAALLFSIVMYGMAEILATRAGPWQIEALCAIRDGQFRRAQAEQPLITWHANQEKADFSAVFLDTPMGGSTPVNYLAGRASYDRNFHCVIPDTPVNTELLRSKADVVFNMISNADDGEEI